MKIKYAAAAGGLLVVGAAIMLAASFPRGLDGTWWAVAGIRDGAADHMEVGELRLTFEGYKMTSVQKLGPGEEFTMPKVFTVMVDKKAKTIDILDTKRELGIYKIEGDTLTLCVGDGVRPTKFESTKGSKVSLVVLKRK